MNNSFIFFGCWNNISCDKEAIYRDVVLNCIKEFEPSINKMFIAGDNWYNTLIKNREDGNSYKYYLVDTLISGYHILYTMNKNIYICVGNHDEDSSNTVNKDCMINTQKYYINKLKKHIDEKTKDLEKLRKSSQEAAELLQGTDGNYVNMAITKLLDDKLPFIEDLKAYDDDPNNVIKLFADTIIGVYEDVSSSYIVIIINTNILSSSYLTDVSNKIKEVKAKRANANKLIFVMGHIPLFYDKHKKEKASKEKESESKKDKASKEKDGESKKEHDITKLKKGSFENVDTLYDIMAENNCIYLCADCHNFNIMKIKKEDKCVIQITSGTGGADPDLIKDLKDKKEVQLLEYNITYYSINSYGYCKINVKENEITVSYNKIIAADKNYESIDELYVYSVKNNEIEYHNPYLTDEEKNKIKIKDSIISNATKNKAYYCDRVAKYSKSSESSEINIIKSRDPQKGVCYYKKGK